jgi:hypothetical protein
MPEKSEMWLTLPFFILILLSACLVAFVQGDLCLYFSIFRNAGRLKRPGIEGAMEYEKDGSEV